MRKEFEKLKEYIVFFIMIEQFRCKHVIYVIYFVLICIYKYAYISMIIDGLISDQSVCLSCRRSWVGAPTRS